MCVSDSNKVNIIKAISTYKRFIRRKISSVKRNKQINENILDENEE